MTNASTAVGLSVEDGSAIKRYPFSDSDFRTLQTLINQRTGIFISDDKRDLVYNRFSKRIRALSLNSFQEYCRFVENDDGAEFQEFIDTITTNLTSFFRERHHFDYLAETVIPMLLKQNANSRRVRIWSAGCSSGEEPYSIAATVDRFNNNLHGWDLKILATDLDSKCIASASSGVYDAARIADLPAREQAQLFTKRDENTIEVNESLKQRITFRRLNLMEQWPMKGQFDVIFCRNVVIYFDKPTQRVLFDRFADLMPAHGHLFVGHSENLNTVCDRFELIGKTVYRKVK